MADLKYRVDVDTAAAKRNIDGLKNTIVAAGSALAGAFAIKEITNVSARFEDLRTTLGILYKDVEVGAQAFEQIKEFATQSIFAVEDLTQTVIKLKGAGLNPTTEQLRLFADVASVSADSVGALQAITDLYARTTAGGLGLEELNRLGDRGIPVFTILAEKLGINRLQISELGKTAEGAQTILRALEEGLEEAFGGASQARANNLSQAFSNFGDAVANAFDAIGQAGLNEALRDATNAITDFVSENEQLIKSIGEGLGTAIRFVVDNAKILIEILAAAFSAAIAVKIVTIGNAVLKLASAFKAAAIAGTVLQGVTGIGLVKVAAGIAAASGAVIAIEKLTGDAADAVNDVNDAIDNLPQDTVPGPLDPGATDAVNEHTRALQEALIPFNQFITKAKEFSENDYRTDLEKANDRLKEAKDVLYNLRMAFVAANGEIENYSTLIQAAKDEVDAATAALNDLKDEQDELAKAGTFEEFFENLIDSSQTTVNELEYNRRAVEELSNAYNSGAISLAVYADALDVVNGNLGRSKTALQDLVSTSLDFQRDIRESTEDAQRELEQLNMTPLERQIDDINHKLDRELKNTIKELERGARLNPELAAEYAQEIENIKEATEKAKKEQADLARVSYETQRSFEYGWKKAFEEYLISSAARLDVLRY